MNVNHDHSAATSSPEADKLENDIEAILDYLILLINELKLRIRKYLSIGLIFYKYKIPLIIGFIIIASLMNQHKKKPIHKKF